MATKRETPAVKAIKLAGEWATCEHPLAQRDHHSCPTCTGTLRRCCDSLIGYYPHRDGCPEVRRRDADAA